jgi:hypothetical protein
MSGRRSHIHRKHMQGGFNDIGYPGHQTFENANTMGTDRLSATTDPTFIVVTPNNFNNQNFSQGTIQFKFSVQPNQVWHPGRSYFLLTLQLQVNNTNAAAAGVQPKMSDGIAFANMCTGNLFSNVRFLIGDREHHVNNIYLPQITYLYNRIGYSGSHLKNNSDILFYFPKFTDRQKITAIDGGFTISNEFSSGGGGAYSCIDYTTGIGENTAAIATGTGLCTFENIITPITGNDPAVRLLPGDQFTIAANANVYTVQTILSPVTCTVIPIPGANIAASLITGVIRRMATDLIPYFGQNQINILFQPGIGIFSLDDGLNDGKGFTIELTPDPYWYLNAVQQSYTVAGAPSGSGNLQYTTITTGNMPAYSYNVNIQTFQFYQYVSKMNIPLTRSLTLRTLECSIYAKQFAAGNGPVDDVATIKLGTKFICIFFLPQTFAIANGSLSQTEFRSQDGGTLNVRDIKLVYNGKTIPENDPSQSAYNATQSMIQQRLFDTLVNTGKWQTEGSGEDYYAFRLSPYYLFDLSTQEGSWSNIIQVHITFGAAITTAFNLCVASFYNKVAQLEYQNGLLTNMVVSGN